MAHMPHPLRRECGIFMLVAKAGKVHSFAGALDVFRADLDGEKADWFLPKGRKVESGDAGG
jgi:hypothetical protein